MFERRSSSSNGRDWAFVRKRTATCFPLPPRRTADSRETISRASSRSSSKERSETRSPPFFVARRVFPSRRRFSATTAPAASRIEAVDR